MSDFPLQKVLRQVLTSVHGSARGYPLLPTFGSLSVRARERGTSRKEHPLLERSHRDRLPRAFFSAMSRHLFACKSRAFQTEYLFPSPSADLEACRKKFLRRRLKKEQPDKIYKTKQTAVPSPRMMRRFIKSRSVALLVFLSPAPLSLFLSTSSVFLCPSLRSLTVLTGPGLQRQTVSAAAWWPPPPSFSRFLTAPKETKVGW